MIQQMSENKLIAIAMAGFMLGGSPWYFISEVGGNSIDEHVRSGLFTALVFPAGYALFRLGKRFPRVASWVDGSPLGLFLLAAAFGAMTAGGATLMAALGAPVWQLDVAVIGVYLTIGYRALSDAMNRDSQI